MDMKVICLFILISFTLIGKSQEYSFPLYFEDAIGNRDTLYFGFDKSASFDINENLGEVNLLRQPYDTGLFAFFSDAATNEEYDCRLETEKNPTYLTKKQYINLLNDRLIEIGLIAKKWPVKISWDQNAITHFNIDKYLGVSNYGLFLTSWHPLNGYPDSFCCGAWPTPDGLTWLSESSFIQIAKENTCLYKANSLKDSISLIYISQMYKYTSVDNIPINSISCWYNGSLDAVCIQNTKGAILSKIEIFNVCGLKVMDKQILSTNETKLNINISSLPNGLYLTRLSQFKNNYLNSTFKIIKRW